MLLHYVAKRETLYLTGIAPKYIAITSIFAVSLRLLLAMPIVEFLAAGVLFYFTYRVVVGLSNVKSVVLAMLCQLVYQGWKLAWLALK